MNGSPVDGWPKANAPTRAVGLRVRVGSRGRSSTENEGCDWEYLPHDGQHGGGDNDARHRVPDPTGRSMFGIEGLCDRHGIHENVQDHYGSGKDATGPPMARQPRHCCGRRGENPYDCHRSRRSPAVPPSTHEKTKKEAHSSGDHTSKDDQYSACYLTVQIGAQSGHPCLHCPCGFVPSLCRMARVRLFRTTSVIVRLARNCGRQVRAHSHVSITTFSIVSNNLLGELMPTKSDNPDALASFRFVGHPSEVARRPARCRHTSRGASPLRRCADGDGRPAAPLSCAPSRRLISEVLSCCLWSGSTPKAAVRRAINRS